MALFALLAALFVVMVLGACSKLQVEGQCVYERTVSTSYTCQPDGKVEHIRVAPGTPEP